MGSFVKEARVSLRAQDFGGWLVTEAPDSQKESRLHFHINYLDQLVLHSVLATSMQNILIRIVQEHSRSQPSVNH